MNFHLKELIFRVRAIPVKAIKQNKAQQQHPIDFDDFGASN